MMECQCKSKNRHMFLSHILRQVNRFHQMFLWPPLNRKIQCSQNFLRVVILFKRPPNPLDRAERPKRTRVDEDDHSAFSAYHHDLEKVSENFEKWEWCLQWNRDA